MNAYERILDSIVSGEFAQGQRVTEEFLTQRLGISRTPIREAIRHLQAEGLLVSDGRGVSVKEFSLDEIQEIYEIRSVLEGQASAAAAQYATPSDIAKMHELNEEMANILGPGGTSYRASNNQHVMAVMDCNRRLHETVMKAGRKSLMYGVVTRMMVLPLIYRSYYFRTPEDVLSSLEEHCQIVRFIENRDSYRAGLTMSAHIITGLEQVLINLSED